MLGKGSIFLRETQSSTTEDGKVQLVGQIYPTACFCNKVLLKYNHVVSYILFTVDFLLKKKAEFSTWNIDLTACEA